MGRTRQTEYLEEGEEAGEQGGGVEGRELGVGDRLSKDSRGLSSSRL